MPAEVRRRDEVVKCCRPERQGLLDLVRDRPTGRAALAKRFADMQDEESRRMCGAQLLLVLGWQIATTQG